METTTLEKRIENLSHIGQEMSMSEMHEEIQRLLIKYSSGSNLQHVSVSGFKTLSHLIQDIMLNPEVYLNDKTPFNCPDCSADLELDNNTKSVKFVKHNI